MYCAITEIIKVNFQLSPTRREIDKNVNISIEIFVDSKNNLSTIYIVLF